MGAVVQSPRGRLGRWLGRWLAPAIALGAATTGSTAAAQSVIVDAEGAVNLGFTQITQGASQPDPDAQKSDVHPTSVDAFFTELRPGITLQTGSPRVTWRGSYVFGGNLSLNGDQLAGYSNQFNLAMSAELNQVTLLTLSAAVAQGGTSFLLGQRPAESGQPELRAPGNPDQISATAVESLTWAAARHLSLQHALVVSANAPQNAFDQRNTAVTASLALDRVFTRDTLGGELHANVSWLRPPQMNLPAYKSLTNDILARWNHDYSAGWNSLLTAGLEQVFTDTGSKPLGFLPAGSISVRYTARDGFAAFDVNHGTATNLQVGAISLTDRVTVRGGFVLDSREFRILGFSGGILHNAPIGEARVSAGTGNALAGDVGFQTAIAKNVLLSARYSVAYQFDQGGGLQPTLAHIALIGVIARYKNTDQPTRPLPTPGRRVDGSDAVGFPVVEEPATE
jgi:hypothetical protein